MSSGEEQTRAMTVAAKPQADLEIWEGIVVRRDGGIVVDNMRKAREVAFAMTRAEAGVPAHCRGDKSLGTCTVIVTMAMRFGMDPYMLANKSYVVNDKLAFESQVIHAIIENSGFMSRRLRDRYLGEGDSRQCEVTGWIKGEEEPFVFTSPKIKDITTKNSPLWKAKPDLQLYYNAVRDWARKYLPEVVLGLYAPEELEERPQAPTIVAAPRTVREAMERVTLAPAAPPVIAAPVVSAAYQAWREGLHAAPTDEARLLYPIPMTLTEAEFEQAAAEKDEYVRSRRGS